MAEGPGARAESVAGGQPGPGALSVNRQVGSPPQVNPQDGPSDLAVARVLVAPGTPIELPPGDPDPPWAVAPESRALSPGWIWARTPMYAPGLPSHLPVGPGPPPSEVPR